MSCVMPGPLSVSALLILMSVITVGRNRPSVRGIYNCLKTQSSPENRGVCGSLGFRPAPPLCVSETLVLGRALAREVFSAATSPVGPTLNSRSALALRQKQTLLENQILEAPRVLQMAVFEKQRFRDFLLQDARQQGRQRCQASCCLPPPPHWSPVRGGGGGPIHASCRAWLTSLSGATGPAEICVDYLTRIGSQIVRERTTAAGSFLRHRVPCLCLGWQGPMQRSTGTRTRAVLGARRYIRFSPGSPRPRPHDVSKEPLNSGTPSTSIPKFPKGNSLWSIHGRPARVRRA